MVAALTAEIFARAILGASVSYGDDPIEACSVGRGYKRRALTAAAVGVQAVCGGTLERIAEILGLSIKNVYAARSIGHPLFVKASRSAEEAVRYHLKVRAERAAALAALAEIDAELLDDPIAPPSAEPAGDLAEPAPPANVPMVAAPSPRPAPSRPASKAAAKPAHSKPRVHERALPKGTRLVNLGDGVQRIEVRPITERVARMAKQQLDRGADLAFVAEAFDCDAEALRAAVDILKGNAA